jgi:hypothetical protein
MAVAVCERLGVEQGALARVPRAVFGVRRPVPRYPRAKFARPHSAHANASSNKGQFG